MTFVDHFYLRKSLDKPLTKTEIEAQQAVADGDRSADVAASRGITEASVKNLIWKACQKLGADGRAHAVAVGFG